LILLGEDLEDTKELNSTLIFAFKTSQEVEKSFNNDCLDTQFLFQHYKSMGNEQFTKSITEKFKSMFLSENTW